MPVFTNTLSFDDKLISTEYSALVNKVMSNGNGFVKFPINGDGGTRPANEEFVRALGKIRW